MSKFKSIGNRVKSIRNSTTAQLSQERLDPDGADKYWLDLRFHDANEQNIKRPKDLEDEMGSPEGSIDGQILDGVQGSMVGMALGDALGAHVEFRPRQYMCENPVTGLEGGGTWGLQKGQFTDDTSMALCLAISLITQKNFNLYDQLVRYKWWYRKGYMSSTGECFDIGAGTSLSIDEFERRQKRFSKKHKIPDQEIDYLSDEQLNKFDVYCSEAEVAGNGALMRLAPVPLFFYRHPAYAVEYSGRSGQITHGDTKAYDACRYYGALIVAAVRGENKNDILDKNFYLKHKDWFGGKPLCNEIMTIAEGSFKRKGGYDDGIRGKGYVVNALEAALWAFWDDGDSFKTGALKAVNLGDDTDTTAAIYGQLAGAYYGFKKLPEKWVKCVYACDFILNLSKWITYEGCKWEPSEQITPYNPLSPSKRRSSDKTALLSQSGLNANTQDSIDEEPVSTIIVTKKSSVGVDENKPVAKRLARTESVHPQNQQGSTVPAVTRKTESFNIPSTSQDNSDSRRGLWTRIRRRARSRARPLDGLDDSIDLDDVNSLSPSTNNKNRLQFPTERGSSDKTLANLPSSSQLTSASGSKSDSKTRALKDEQSVFPINATKNTSVVADENKPVAKRLARTESVHPENQQGSSVLSAVNGGAGNQNNTHLPTTSQLQSININENASLKVLNSNKQSSTIQTSTFPSNSSKYYETAPGGSYQHGTGLDPNHSLHIENISMPSPATTDNQSLTISDNKQFYTASQTVSSLTNDKDVSKKSSSQGEAGNTYQNKLIMSFSQLESTNTDQRPKRDE